MTRRHLLGMLTPSSNTVLEPVTSRILDPLYPRVTAHFSRFRVTEISLEEHALAQFDHGPILEASRLLADARTDTIAWNGTSASWLGFDVDEELCRSITKETGIPAATSVLALNEALRERGARHLGLVTPYLREVQERIMDNYRGIGIDCIAESHFQEQDNFSFAEFDEDFLAGRIRQVAEAGPDAIAILCTNLRGAGLAASLEQEFGIPILDSVSVVVWKSMKLAGLDPGLIRGWGSLFTDA